MIAFATLVLLTVPMPVAKSCTDVSSLVVCMQDGAPRRPASPPGGGTPEPATLLLMAGGVLGYGALRLGRRSKAGKADNATKL